MCLDLTNTLMYTKLTERKKIFKRLVGVKKETFEHMVEIVRKAENQRIWKETRGRNPKLSIEDQVLLCLWYLRVYTTQFYLGMVMWIAESNVCRICRKIENILIKSWEFNLPKKKELYEWDFETLLLDATECEIERPKNRQRKYYSGKQKKHTQKVQILVDKRLKIMGVKWGRGKRHDKKLFDKSKLPIPKEKKLLADSWYQGIQKKHKNTILPKKWSKHKPLTKENKKSNKEKASNRIYVEHVIWKLKIFNILDLPYRNRRKRFMLRFNLISWIYNYERF